MSEGYKDMQNDDFDEKPLPEPSESVRLPIGFEVDGVRYRDVVVDELIGLDDHLVLSKKAGKNSSKSTSLVLCRVIQEISGVLARKKNPESMIDRSIVQKMYGPDRDFLLAQVYALSGRGHIVFAGECPRCGRVQQEDTHVLRVPVIEWPEDAPNYIEFELDSGLVDPKTGEKHRKGKLLFPTGRIQELSGDIGDMAEAIDSLLCALIRDLGAFQTVDREQIKRMKSRDRSKLLEIIASDFPGMKMWKEVECDCGRQYELRADLSAFFGGQKQKEKSS